MSKLETIRALITGDFKGPKSLQSGDGIYIPFFIVLHSFIISTNYVKIYLKI